VSFILRPGKEESREKRSGLSQLMHRNEETSREKKKRIID